MATQSATAAVVATVDELEVHGGVERSEDRLDFLACAERVASALHQEDGHPNARQMGGSRFGGLPRRVQRIAQQHEAVDLLPLRILWNVCGHVRRDPAAHRLAADGHASRRLEVPNDLLQRGAPGLLEHGRAVGRAAVLLRVKKVEGHDVHASSGDPSCHVDHPAMPLVGAGAMREHEQRRCGGGRGEVPCGHRA